MRVRLSLEAVRWVGGPPLGGAPSPLPGLGGQPPLKDPHCPSLISASLGDPISPPGSQPLWGDFSCLREAVLLPFISPPVFQGSYGRG